MPNKIVMNLRELYENLRMDLGTLNRATLTPDSIIDTSFTAVIAGENATTENLILESEYPSHQEFSIDTDIVKSCLTRTSMYLNDRGHVPPPDVVVRSHYVKEGRLVVILE